MSRKTILIIEDDAAIRRGVVDALAFAGYATHEAADGVEGLRAAISVDCDLALLDLVLPDGDGFEILSAARETRPSLPVIILTARGEESDRVRGLQLGADDYVVKPFSVRELLARVDAVLRRSAERPADVRQTPFSGGCIDFDRSEARFDDGGRVAFSEREWTLLRFLVCNPGRAVSREEILERVWRINPRAIVETRTIDMHIVRLREKLRDDPGAPRIIQTVRGRGYMFAIPEGE